MELLKHHGGTFKAVHVSLALIVLAYFFGAFSYSRNLWPIELLRQIKDSGEAFASPQVSSAQFDSFKRLTFYPGKTQVECPVQGKGTGVLLVLGQSNAANQAHKRFTTHYPNHVVNYFDGKCYVASSPLLGATGAGGEYLTALADHLISENTYNEIVIINAAVGGSPISRWQRDGDLNELLIALIKDVRSKYTITDIIWHQGETDAAYPFNTTTKIYVSSFSSLVGTLTEQKVKAPIFVLIATRWCRAGPDWTEINPVSVGQRMLVDNRRIFLGVDTDKLVELKDRYDTCHFSESGQIKTAKALADSITAVKNTRK
jgi:hypothetical protein